MFNKLKIYTSLFFLVPMFLALYFKIYLMAILLLTVTIFSIIFHIFDEKKLKIIDPIFAYILIASNLYLCFLFRFNLIYFLPALLFVLLALICLVREKKNYELYHSLWHIFSGIITIFCILGYISKFI